MKVKVKEVAKMKLPVRGRDHSAAEEEWTSLPEGQGFLAEYFGFCLKLWEEQPEGCIAPTMFYLFWCEKCGHPAKDYKRGFNDFLDGPYFRCSYCGSRQDNIVSLSVVSLSMVFVTILFFVIGWVTGKVAGLFDIFFDLFKKKKDSVFPLGEPLEKDEM